MEMDAYAASKIAGFAGAFGGVDATSINSSNILTYWDNYLEYMTSQGVNRDNLRCKMTPAFYKLLKEASGITRFVDAGTGIRAVDRNVAKLDGVVIEEVRPELMKSAYDFTTGWAVADGANQIDMLFYDPDSIVAPIVYDVSMVTPPSAATKGKNVYYESYYYDVFALNQRQAGFFAHVTAPSIGTLTVTSTAGTAAGATNIAYTGAQIDQAGNPFAGLKAYITSGNNSAPSVSYGSDLPGGVTWTECTGSNPVALTSQTANKYVTVALVNAQTGKAIAAGSATEVVGA